MGVARPLDNLDFILLLETSTSYPKHALKNLSPTIPSVPFPI